MGQVLHGSATTTEAVRRAIQHSQKILRALSQQYGINQKTIAKWKKRDSVNDLPTGPENRDRWCYRLRKKRPLLLFAAHNFGRKLKSLKGLTPYEFICKCWTNQPDRFNLDPIHQMQGLNS